MYVARILYPVKVLGPGDRIGIWFDGCIHHCKGCSNPELWAFDEQYKTDLKTVMQLIDTIASDNKVDGFTLTGGDPMLQPEALEELLPELNKISGDIICYSGYQQEELDWNQAKLLGKIAVLIDGKYVDEQNNGSVLRGSANQRIIILNEQYRQRYEDYISTATNEIQNFRTRDTLISVGIHDRDYEEKLEDFANQRGFVQSK